MLAEIGTGRSGSRTGSTDLVALRVPHHVAGSAAAPAGGRPTSSPASAASRRAAASRSGTETSGSAVGAPELGDEPAERQRSRWAAVLVLDRDAELREEPRRLLAVVVGRAHRAHHEPATGAGAGDVEEPALLHQERPGGHGRDEVGVTGAVDTDPVGAQQRRAAAQVGPALLLDVGDDDEVPLQSLGPVGGEQPDGSAADPSLGQGVGRASAAPRGWRRRRRRRRGRAGRRRGRRARRARRWRRGRGGHDGRLLPRCRPGDAAAAATRCSTTGARGRPRRRRGRLSIRAPWCSRVARDPARSTSGPSISSRNPGSTTASRSSSRDVRRALASGMLLLSRAQAADEGAQVGGVEAAER